MAIYQGGKILSGGGPSPFSIAEKAGFEGTEAEFNELLANIDEAVTKEELENAINNIPAPDVSGQISEHNIDENAHNDIRQAIETAKESVKNDLLNGAGVAYDTLKELGELIDQNHDAIDALEIVATNKADKEDLTNHINDKNNPHGVTAEDVGARPDTWMPTPADIGAAASSHGHSNLASRGNVNAETGTTSPAVSGLSMTNVYSTGHPTNYGNMITLNGSGQGEILIGWSGTSGAHAPNYIRSKRDTADANWSDWAQIYTTAHKPTPEDIGAQPASTAINTSNIGSQNVNWAQGASYAQYAQNNDPAAYSLKNICAGTWDMGAGYSLASGHIYFVYE